MNRLQKSLGLIIRDLRRSSNLTQEELGERANLHTTYIGSIERGERNPSLKSLEKIAKALNVRVGDLFRFIDYEDSPSIERMKAEIFSVLRDKDTKTISFLLNLIRHILKNLEQF